MPNHGNKSPTATKISSNNTNLEINSSKSPNPPQNTDFSNFLDVSAHTCASSQTTINETELENLSDPDITQDLESELRNDEEPVNFHDSDLGKHQRFLSFEGISPVPKINRPTNNGVKPGAATPKLSKNYNPQKDSNKANNQENSKYFETIEMSTNIPKAPGARINKMIKTNNFYGGKQQLSISKNAELNQQISEVKSWYEPVPMADIYTPNESITRIDSEQLKNIGSQKSIFQSTPCVKKLVRTPGVQITKEIFNMSIEGESDESDENEVTRQNTGARNSHKFDILLLECLKEVKFSEKVSKQKIEVNLRSKVEFLGETPNFEEQFKETLLRLVDQGTVQRMSGKGMTGSFKLA